MPETSQEPIRRLIQSASPRIAKSPHGRQIRAWKAISGVRETRTAIRGAPSTRCYIAKRSLPRGGVVSKVSWKELLQALSGATPSAEPRLTEEELAISLEALRTSLLLASLHQRRNLGIKWRESPSLQGEAPLSVGDRSHESLARNVHYAAGLPLTDASRLIEAMERVIATHLAESHSVEIEDVGTWSKSGPLGYRVNLVGDDFGAHQSAVRPLNAQRRFATVAR